ncbi:MAG: signal peptidase I [Hyphomicrobiaceae bacterium]
MSVETDANDMSSDTGWWDTLKIVIQALAIALIVRVFLYQPFNIPSGSMKPTLLVGDYLFVSKLSYGYSKYSFPYRPNLFEGRIFADKPERGDVVVFKLPSDNKTDYIKRVVGLPGDRISVQDGILHINGQAVPRVRDGVFETRDGVGGPLRKIPRYRETLPNGVSYHVLDSNPNGAFDNTGPYEVPEGKYFMMGDNRDNSTDSRYTNAVGYVPYENLVGRAEVLFFSAETDEPDSFSISRPWNWPFEIRWKRFFDMVR